jgi:hypothetical protein
MVFREENLGWQDDSRHFAKGIRVFCTKILEYLPCEVIDILDTIPQREQGSLDQKHMESHYD